MNKGRILSIFTIFCLILTISSITIQAQNYQVVVFAPTGGFDDTSGFGVGGVQRAGSGRLAGFPIPDQTHALLWIGDNPTPLDLHPGGNWVYSKLNDTDGVQQAGYVVGNSQYAAVWNGTAGSFVQLCGLPGSNCGYSEALATAGGQQVGFLTISGIPPSGLTAGDGDQEENIITGTQRRAALWMSAPGTYVDLHPRNLNGSVWSDTRAFDTDGTQQVGFGLDESRGIEFRYRALLWNGSRDSFVDLTPPGNVYNYVYASGVKNGTQVGYAWVYSPNGACQNALVWHNTAASYRVLGACALAEDTNGTTHVGVKGVTAPNGWQQVSHAWRWDGDSGAGFDLHTLLPAGVYIHSTAYDIDEFGNIVGTAQRASDFRTVAVLWRPLAPVPNSLPNIALTSPSVSGSYQAKTPIMLDAVASDTDGTIASVEFMIDDEIVQARLDKTDAYRMQWTPVRAGSYRIRARATDNQGGVSVSRPVIVRILDY